jgi:hypothetical protein
MFKRKFPAAEASTVGNPKLPANYPKRTENTGKKGAKVVRPPGFEPGFLPYGCRPEAVRPVLAGLRRADAHVPVLDQTRLRPHGPREARLIAKALTFPAFLGASPSSAGTSRSYAVSRTASIFSTVRDSMGIWADIR